MEGAEEVAEEENLLAMKIAAAEVAATAWIGVRDVAEQQGEVEEEEMYLMASILMAAIITTTAINTMSRRNTRGEEEEEEEEVVAAEKVGTGIEIENGTEAREVREVRGETEVTTAAERGIQVDLPTITTEVEGMEEEEEEEVEAKIGGTGLARTDGMEEVEE